MVYKIGFLVSLVSLLLRIVDPKLFYEPLRPCLTIFIYGLIIWLLYEIIRDVILKNLINWNEPDAVVRVPTGKNDGSFDFHEIKKGYRRWIPNQNRFVTIGYSTFDLRIIDMTLEELRKKYKEIN